VSVKRSRSRYGFPFFKPFSRYTPLTTATDPAAWCKTVQTSASGVWNQYWWPKPGETEPSRKISYHLSAKGTHYVISAGVYDDKATIAELSKVSSMK
jgi:signal transduction histidine kinase